MGQIFSCCCQKQKEIPTAQIKNNRCPSICCEEDKCLCCVTVNNSKT